MHVDRPERHWFEQAVAAVRPQSRPEWELCITDDASREDWIDQFLKQQSEADSRIRYVRAARRLQHVYERGRASA